MARLLLAVVFALAFIVPVSAAEGGLEGGVNPGFHEPPPWFKSSFLDLQEDVAEAAETGKRVMLYFYQDGCPYCAKLLDDNFGQKAIAEKTRELYDVVAVNMWGDREVIDLAGRSTTEKDFAKAVKVMFTPTLIFLDERGRGVFRVNGYYHPGKFDRALDFAAGPADEGLTFADYLQRFEPRKATGELHDQPFFMTAPYALARNGAPAARPLLVLFEQPVCITCDELHGDVLSRTEVRDFITDHFDVVRLDRGAETPVLTPSGERSTARQWAKSLRVQYTPTMVFFDGRGREVFRTEAYLKTFHLQSALEYVATGAYRKEPEFQRFVQARADRLREEGVTVDLWE